jgi:hypothetical protein
MTLITRNQIMDALKSQLSDNMTTVKNFVRKYQEFSNTSLSAEMPLLMICKPKESYPQRAITGLPPKRTWTVEIIINISVGQDQSVIPDETVCDIMDDLDNALRPPTGQDVLTLGGLVDHCYIMGDVVLIPGDLDGIGMIHVPLEIVVP